MNTVQVYGKGKTFRGLLAGLNQQMRRHGDDHGHEATPERFSGPYRKPVIPPNRPLAFALGGVIFCFGMFLVTGGFMYSPADPKMHPLDRRVEIFHGLPTSSWGRANEDPAYDVGYGKAKFEQAAERS